MFLWLMPNSHHLYILHAVHWQPYQIHRIHLFRLKLHQYVKNLVGKSNGKIDNWRSITEWLEDAGYRKQIPDEIQSDDHFSVKILVKRANVVLEKNQIAIDINLRIIAPTSVESNVSTDMEIPEANPSLSIN
ncbi:hypothetical protein HCU40_03215 [Pseudanabaena biceps]|nr:hypothetical protein [Pseudanabaena biceps]